MSIREQHALILLRGLPGSGKSTLAKVLGENGKYPVFSIDDFFTNQQSGRYRFQFDQNHLAYAHCISNTETAMKENAEKIIIDNTFTMEWEMEPYIKLASVYRYTLFVMTVEKRHDGKNIHGVQESQIRRMAEKYKVVLY